MRRRRGGRRMLLGEFSFPSQFAMPCSEIGGEDGVV
jgi:hypothetical protein